MMSEEAREAERLEWMKVHLGTTDYATAARNIRKDRAGISTEQRPDGTWYATYPHLEDTGFEGVGRTEDEAIVSAEIRAYWEGLADGYD